MTVLVVPGAFTASGAFGDLARDLSRRLPPGLGPVEVLELPARVSRLPQLHRGGLAAADLVIDEAITRATGAGPVVVVGHSLGGLLSLRASRRHALDALVLLMPAPPGGLVVELGRLLLRDPSAAVAFASLTVTTLPVRRWPLPAPRGLFTEAASAEVRDRSRAWRVDESWLVLAQLVRGTREPVTPTGIPTLVVAGRDDGLIPAPVVRRLAASLDADLRELPVAHNFNEEPAGDVVTDEVVSWLTAAVPAAATHSRGRHHD